MQKTAIVFGASGLTGSYLVKELTQNEQYQTIKAFNRRTQNYNNAKIKEHLINFNQLNEYAHEFKADDVFCCLGTTLKKAGSKENFFEIDHDLPLQIARICQNNHCDTFIAISSIGANAKSSNYYIRTKGLMEQNILNLNFRYQAFVRPSMLLGSRTESRPAETFGKIMMKVFGFLFMGNLKKFRGIHAQTVAKAMINIINQQNYFSKAGKNIFESDELKKIAEKNNHDKQ
ncbi:MAG TPA: NAD-dependent epimerase/dehydratase family protein [Bacteroidales bacterium]|nr:NAD-dependent epimerase/dehydratase family protein [Bacteroidales bacterium]